MKEKKFYIYHLDERKEIVRDLFEAGISIKTMADGLGVSLSTISHDVHSLPGESLCVDRPRREYKAFTCVLQKYSLLTLRIQEESFLELKKEEARKILTIHDILRKYLSVDETLVFLQGMAIAMEKLVVPECSEEQLPYLKLLQAVFGKTSYPYEKSAQLWFDYMKKVADCEIPAPESLSSLRRYLADDYIKRERACIAPVWPSNAQEIIEEQLYTVPSQYERVLRMRFGLREPKMTMVQIGRIFDLSRERIRQLEKKGLEYLRHPTRSSHLKFLISPLSETLRSVFSQKEAREKIVSRLSSLPQENPDTDMIPILMQTIDDLRLSIRAYNALVEMGLYYLGELVQKDPGEMLKIRNFGRKSLGEIRQQLGKLGLSLGMRLSQTLAEQFLSDTTKKPKVVNS